MYIFRRMNSLALMGGLGLVFAGIMACSTDDSETTRNREPLPARVDTVIKIDPVTGDTSKEVVETPQTLDSTRQIDPVTGDTFYRYDTTYVPADTTLRVVGNSALLITEISPMNLDWLDENGGDPGWVELYNARSDSSINLKVPCVSPVVTVVR